MNKVSRVEVAAGAGEMISAVSGLLDDLLAQVYDKQSAAGFELMHDSEIVSLASAIEAIGRKVDSLRIGVAAQINKRTSSISNADPAVSLAHARGFKNAKSFLQVLTKASAYEINSRLRLGVAVVSRESLTGEALPEEFPYVAEAVTKGVIDVGAAGSIVKHLKQLGDHVGHDKIRFAEERIILAATGIQTAETGNAETGNAETHDELNTGAAHADDVTTIVNGWCAALDQEGKEPDLNVQAKRYFSIGTEHNGLVPVKGALLPEIAAKLGRAFDAINNPRVRNNQQALDGLTADSVANEIGSVQDFRTSLQLRHDALATVIGFALKNEEMPNLGGEAVTLVVQVKNENLHKPHGYAWIEDTYGNQTPQHAGLARHAACVGSVLRVTQDKDGKIVALGNQGRIFNAKQRKAIILRDGGCVIPGCGTPSTWCEIHHVEEHSKGGATHTSNGVTLCWYHHRHIEQHGWEVRIKNGVPEVRAPRWLDPGKTWRKHEPLHDPPETSVSEMRRPEMRRPETIKPETVRLIEIKKEPRRSSVRFESCLVKTGIKIVGRAKISATKNSTIDIQIFDKVSMVCNSFKHP